VSKTLRALSGGCRFVKISHKITAHAPADVTEITLWQVTLGWARPKPEAPLLPTLGRIPRGMS